MRLAHVLDDGIAGTKDVAGANDAFDKACTRYDNGDACQKIGERLGMAKQNLPHAFEPAKRGCELDPKYCGTLAEFYRLGYGLAAADQAEATRYYRTACEAGGGWCDAYGRRAHDGIGMPADVAAAQTALERGCNGGWPASCYQASQYLIAAKTDDARERRREHGLRRQARQPPAISRAGSRASAAPVARPPPSARSRCSNVRAI